MIWHQRLYLICGLTAHTSLSTSLFLLIICSLKWLSHTLYHPLNYNNFSLYASRAALDCKIPSGAVSIHQSTADLAVLVDSLHSRELSNEPSIQFIRCAFAVLIKRLSSCSMSVKGNPSLQGSLKNYIRFIVPLNSFDRFDLYLFFSISLSPFFTCTFVTFVL